MVIMQIFNPILRRVFGQRILQVVLLKWDMQTQKSEWSGLQSIFILF